MTLKKGQIITVKIREHAYGYSPIYLEPGETVTVINPKVPAVTGKKPYFAYCERVVNGDTQRFGIFPDNVKVIRLTMTSENTSTKKIAQIRFVDRLPGIYVRRMVAYHFGKLIRVITYCFEPDSDGLLYLSGSCMEQPILRTRHQAIKYLRGAASDGELTIY